MAIKPEQSPIDVDKLRKQLQDIAAEVKEGQEITVPFSYMYGDPIEFLIKREGDKLTIKPNFTFSSMDVQKRLEEPVRQVIDNVMNFQGKKVLSQARHSILFSNVGMNKSRDTALDVDPTPEVKREPK
jgi:hypothetical protein